MAHERHLAMIPREVDAVIVHQRALDGFINATAMCKASSKLLADYMRLGVTKEFLGELSSVMGIPITELVVRIQGGIPELQGTWVHPKVAINLGQWCSPKFAVAVSIWVEDWLNGKKSKNLPYHLERYIVNSTSIPPTHFSMLNELTFALIGPLEYHGYTLPDDMVPDISEGRMFSKWLRDNGHNPDGFPNYTHSYADGRNVPARMYPISLLESFRTHFYEVWIPTRMVDYFKKRDAVALEHLRVVFPSLFYEQKKLK